MEKIIEKFKEMYSYTDIDLELYLKKYENQIIYMNETGGNPIVVKYNGKLLLVDGAKETPLRRSLCYDVDARLSRKKFPPESSVKEECEKNNVRLMNEELYRFVQTIIPMDEKTSSWIETPEEIRSLGGALFADVRYGHVFVYHNSAESYYSSRGFRVYLELK